MLEQWNNIELIYKKCLLDSRLKKRIVWIGTWLLIDKIYFALLMLFYSIILKDYVLILLLFSTLNFLRIYVGGYHAKTPFHCFFETNLYFFCLIVCMYCNLQNIIQSIFFATLFSVVILIISPVESKKKGLSLECRGKIKKKIYFQIVGYWLLIGGGLYVGSKLVIAILYSIIGVGFLAILGKVQEWGLQSQRK